MSDQNHRGGVRSDLHQRNLDYTLKELQKRIQEHETQLETLRSTTTVSPEVATSPTATLSIMKAAFEDVARADPFLPFPESVLPALLALRKTHNAIAESRAFLASQKPALSDVRRRLETSRAELADQEVLSSALKERLENLRREEEAGIEETPEDVARQRVEALREKKRHYDRERAHLIKAFKKFVDDRLAPLLAAEELGGPVVGDMMDVDEEDLAGGFDARGKPKKAKSGGAGEEDKRQRRLDELWGNAVVGGGAGGALGEEGRDEKTAAGAEMRELTEALLNQVLDAGGNTAASYVKVDKESSAARFLVRSKVALFHPKDATMLRLVDFGREIDD